MLVIGTIALVWWLKYELIDRKERREQWSREFDIERERRESKFKKCKREIVLKLRTCVVNLKESKSDFDAYYDLKKMVKLIDDYNDEIEYGTIAITSGLKFHLDGAKDYKVNHKTVISAFQDMADELEAELE